VRTADPRETACWLAAERKRQLQSHFREADRPPPQTPEKRKKQPTQEVSPPKRSTSTLTAAARAAWTRRDRDALGRLKVVELKQLCESVGEISSGNKAALVDRLLTPANPALLVERKRAGKRVPRDRTCNYALLCALDAAQEPLTKERWMAAAEATRIANVSLYEKSGPMAYDGWAGVGGDLTQGDPPLVVKERGSRYKLSTCGGDDAGKAVASALHAKAHQRGWCSCSRPPAPAVPVRLEAPEQAMSPLHAAARRARVRTPETRRAPPPPRSGSPPSRRSTAPPTPPTTASKVERARGRRRSPVPDDDSDDSVLGFSPPRPPRPPATPASSIMDLTTPRVPPSSAMDLATPAPRSGASTAPYSNAMSLSSEASDVVDLTRLSSPSPARAASPIDLISPAASPAHDGGGA
jgi:hypothetical protein